PPRCVRQLSRYCAAPFGDKCIPAVDGKTPVHPSRQNLKCAGHRRAVAAAASAVLTRLLSRPVLVHGHPLPRSGMRTQAPFCLAVPPRRDGSSSSRFSSPACKKHPDGGSSSRHQHVRPQLTLGGLSIVLGEFGSSVDDGAHLRVDGLKLSLRHAP